MKLRTSCFDLTVLKKDITRFFPAWAIYLTGGLLVASVLLQEGSFSMADTVLQLATAAMPLISAGYALVMAMLLFGDLCSSRLCNALHAMPLRRKGWFLTHWVSGILMQLVPNLALGLILMSGLGEFFYAALIWLGASSLQYLFFFGLATVCMLCCGNRIGAVALYALGNFLSMLVYWVAEEMYVPLLYGVKLRMEDFSRYSPLIQMMNSGNRMRLDWICDDCTGIYSYKICENCTYSLDWGDGWGYLGVAAGLGVAFAALALLLYRRRKLECAGDFAAVRPVGWIFTAVAGVCGGMVFRIFSFDSGAEYFLLLCGLTVGFFLSQMLLTRRVRVFHKKNWLRLGAFVLLWAASLGLTAVDAFGIESKIPDIQKVEKVQIADRYLSDYYLEAGTECVTLRDEEDIGRVTAIHKLLLEEGKNRTGYRVYTDHSGSYVEYYGAEYRTVTIHYTLTNGSTLTRVYQTKAGNEPSDAWRRLSRFFENGAYVLGWDSLEAFLAQIDAVQLDAVKNMVDIEGEDAASLLKALWQDAEAGNLSQNHHDYTHNYTYLSLQQLRPSGHMLEVEHIFVSPQAENTWAFLTQYAKTHDIEDWFY